MKDIDIPHAGDRMASLINSIRATDGLVNTTFIISSLLPSSHPNVTRYRPAVNEQFKTLVPQLDKEGLKVLLSNVSSGVDAIEWPYDFIGSNGKPDNIHPNDVGYAKMASFWAAQIELAINEGTVQPPVGALNANAVCAP